MKSSLHRRDRGVALIIVLSFVVLVTALVIAFLSRSQLNRQITSVSNGGFRADSIAKAAMDVIVGDLKQEIIAGSESARVVSVNGENRTFYPPYALESDGTADNSTVYPFRPAPIVASNAAYANLLKVSTTSPLYPGGPVRGAGDTSVLSANKRSVSATRWNKPQLTTGNIPPPAWVYISQSGKVGVGSGGTAFGENAATLATLKLPDTGETGNDPTVGRFAYAIYNVGGLLDINVAGNALTSGNEHRGRLHHADLTALLTGADAISSANAATLISWRNPTSRNDVSAIEGQGGLFDPKRNFIDVNKVGPGSSAVSEQLFLTRQDLIAYTQSTGTPLPAGALPHLTIFSREYNAPVWQSNANSATAVDLSFADTVKLKQRFPLSRIKLLENPSGNATQISTYFGLTLSRNGKYWEYGNAGVELPKILSLSEISGREPNFFEILKSIIAPSSLNTPLPVGVGSPAISVYSSNVEKMIAAKVFQIGANIIDHYDQNNHPTDIFAPLSGTSASAAANRFFGVENLPYLRTVAGVFHAEAPSGGGPVAVKGWLQPQLFNPYGRALSATPMNIRLRVVGQAALKIDTSVAAMVDFTDGSVSTPEYIAASLGTGIFAPSFSALGNDVTSAWINGSAVSAALTQGGFLIGDQPVSPGTNPPQYTIVSGNGTAGNPLTFILEYEAANNDFRPYAVWHGLQTAGGANPAAVMVTAMASGVYTFDPGVYPRLQKNDPRTELEPILARATSHTAPPVDPVNITHLDRDFRGVGEMGYVFRGNPDTTLRFHGASSPDAALLDFFTVDDNEVIGGRIAMNTRSTPALIAMLTGTALNSGGAPMDRATATTYANAIVARNATNANPASIQSRGELVQLVSGVAGGLTGQQTQAPIRGLAEVANTRTWNLMIDVIAQSGRIPKSARATASPTTPVSGNFMVEGERRYWLHIAIDRYTGEVVGDPIVELVTE